MDQIKKFFWGLFQILSRFLVKLSSTKMLHGWIWKQTRIRKASFRSIYYRGLYREYFLPNFSKNGKWKLLKDRDRAIVEVIIATSRLDFLVAKTKATTKKIFSDCLVSEYFCTLLCKTIDLWSPDGAYEYFNLQFYIPGTPELTFTCIFIYFK